MRGKWLWGLCLFLCLSCSDKIDKRDMYTFTAMTIMDYLQDNPELSDFAKIVEISKISPRSDSPVSALLNLYGERTCFAPTNEAVKLYLDSVCGTGQYDVATLPQEIADEIVHNCVIEEKALYTTKFLGGALVERTLNDHHLIIELGDFGEGVTVRVNRRARVIDGDIKVYNGYVHIVDRVVPQMPNTVPALINEQSNLRIFARLLQATTWADSMLLYRDDEYDKIYERIQASNLNPDEYPLYRLYGYSAFTETDSVFHEDWGVPLPIINPEDQSIENWEEILSIIQRKCQEAYPQATSEDIQSQDNAVNQFISYHLLPLLGNIEDIVHGHIFPKHTNRNGLSAGPYTRPMGKPNRILKLEQSTIGNGYFLNRKSVYDYSFNGTGEEIGCDYEGVHVRLNNGEPMDNYAPNGYFHPIDHVLTYNDEVRQNVLNERLRYSPVAFIPELFSVKKSPRGDGGGDVGYCPFDYFKKSIKWEGLPQNNKGIRTSFGLNWLAHKKGFTLTLPLLPVPYAGMWEIRLRLNNDPTQLVQFHFGSSPRISEMKYIDTRPLDIPQLYTYTNVGQSVKRIIEYPSDRDLLYDSLLCMEIDQRLKALGWMRIPKYPDDGYYAYDRYCYQGRRMILTRQYMEPDKTYYLRMQWKTGAGSKESELDFFELVPKSVYDNPYRAEDVW